MSFSAYIWEILALMFLRLLAAAAAALLIAGPGSAARTSTLRVDCIFTGGPDGRGIALSTLSEAGPWAGRHADMDRAPLRGNGQISLRDKASSELIYVNSFSTLFQEWLNTEEATRSTKAFENVFLVPMPDAEAVLRIELYGNRGELIASQEFPVDPDDILIRKTELPAAPHRYIMENGSPSEKIDLAIVAEGYTPDEAELFYEDAARAARSIFAHSPFKELSERFNVVAVALPSAESGVSVPHDGSWKNTALGSHFDTFYSDRYLTTLNIFRLHDALAGIPYEHIIILANTDTYGGGGIFNSYLLASAHNRWTDPVIVHEFGHSFAGLADEYFYDDQYTEFYYPDTEPWEPNITTLKDFSLKWADMVPEGCVPVSKETQLADPEGWAGKPEDFSVGLYEGAGYQSEGVYRGFPECRMKINDWPSFCPVCERAIREIIEFYTD